MRTVEASVPMLALVATAGLACWNAPEQEVETEAATADISRPKSAPPGSLGGICGKKFAGCRDGQGVVDRFANLKRTSVSFSSEVKGSGFDERRKVVVKMRVPRLVDDHREKHDQLEMTLAFSQFDAECSLKEAA